jgi:uncharacterized integral membrane protein (TIGR00698 family)
MQTLTLFRPSSWRALIPGLLTVLTIALAATFISEHYGGPQLLYALLFGMAFNFLAADPKTGVGIEFASRQVLRFGVALLGARITIAQLAALGVGPVVLVIVGVVATIGFGAWLGRRLERSAAEGLLTGGAVAICGASAALALSAVLPKNADNQRITLLTVAGVTALSTLAMILYPALARTLGLDADATAAGIFFGGTIHDVAQVVGAGFMISPKAAETAIVVKLLRIALLVPAVLAFSLMYRGQQTQAESRPPLLPGFLVAFLVLVGLNSVGVIPKEVTDALSLLSRWCLVAAISALGIKTSLQQLADLGWRPVALMVGETVFLAALNLSGLGVMRGLG